jgi:predicted nuclease with TOPRIM domain
MLTRSTFNRICINSYRKPRAHQCAHYFAQVYEAAMQYVQQLRARNITTGYDFRAKENDVKERMDQLVQQRLSRYNTTKMEKKMELIQESIYKLEEEKKILLESNNRLEISYKSVPIV